MTAQAVVSVIILWEHADVSWVITEQNVNIRPF